MSSDKLKPVEIVDFYLIYLGIQLVIKVETQMLLV